MSDYDCYIKSVVDAAPPFTDEQKLRLRAIFCGSGGGAGTGPGGGAGTGPTPTGPSQPAPPPREVAA